MKLHAQAASTVEQSMASSDNNKKPNLIVCEQEETQEKLKQLHLDDKSPMNNPPSNGEAQHSLQEARTAVQSHSSAEDEKLAIYVRLFEHASACPLAAGCTSRNCSEMKKHIQHARVCRSKVQGGCRVCKRIWKLLQVHASKCTNSENCTVPQCFSVKQKMMRPSPLTPTPSVNNDTSMVCQPAGNAFAEAPTALPEVASAVPTDTQARIRVVEHTLACQDSECSFAGCAHTKRCLLRRRSRPGATVQGGCRTCQSIYMSLQQSNPALANSVAATRASAMSTGGFSPYSASSSSSSMPVSPGKRTSKKISKFDPPASPTKRSRGPQS